MKGYEGQIAVYFQWQFWQFSQSWTYIGFGWTNLHEIGDQIKEFFAALADDKKFLINFAFNFFH